MTVASLVAQLVVNGADVSSYIVDMVREEHLAEPGQVLTVNLSASAPQTFQPWNTVTLKENGTLVFTGYLDKIHVNRPIVGVQIQAKDTYKRAADWFIHENLTAKGETASYWVATLCGLCGLPYTFVDSSGSGNAIGRFGDSSQWVDLGLRTVSEALSYICIQAGWVMRVNASGVLEFISAFAPQALTGTISNIMKLDVENNDLTTRNSVRVYGSLGVFYKRYVPILGMSERIMVFGNWGIDTQDKAQALGDSALDQFASINTMPMFDIVGDPSMKVGNQYNSSVVTFAGQDTLTDLRSKITQSGYEMNLTLGRRASRYPQFPVGTGGSTPAELTGAQFFAYYAFEETSGTTDNASFPIDSNFNMPGTPIPSLGLIGNGYDLTGSRNLNWNTGPFGLPNGWRIATSRTFALWVYFTDLTADRYPMAYYKTSGGGAWQYRFRYDLATAKLIWDVAGSSADAHAISTASIGTGLWYFLVGWFDSTLGRIGFSVNNEAPVYVSTDCPAVTGYNLHFGIFQDGSLNTWRLNGYIDEFGIWGLVLSDASRTWLYHQGLGRTYPFN